MQTYPLKPLFFSLVARFRILAMWLVAAAAIASPAYGYSVQIYGVNSGGSAASPFVADAYYSGGSASSTGATIDTSGVTSPAPQAVYQTERYGNSTYTLPSLTPARSYVVRLHFAEIYWSQAGKRIFNVSINGTQVLTNFDIYADAGASNKATIKEFTAAANGSGQIVVGFVGVTDSAKVSGIEILDAGLPDPPFCLNADIDKGSSYSGVGVAPDTGTTWNELGASVTLPYTWSNLVNSQGISGTTSVTLTSGNGGISSWSADTPGNPNPLNVMKDYLFGNTYTVTVSGLAQKNYLLYVYAHGDAANQNSTVTVNGANVLSGSGVGVTGTSGSDYRNIFVSGGEGYSYLKFPVSVSTSGTLRFTTASYLNGFQVMEYPKPTITTQPPATPSATVNSNFTMSVAATGEGTLTYQWRKGGVNLSNGATGNGSATYAGVMTNTLAINTAQIGDSGNYDVVITNEGGPVTSNTAALTVSNTVLPPSIAQGGQPSNQTLLSGSTASFSVTANGTSPLAYQWYKGGSLLTNGTTAQGSTISGANSAQLTITNTKIADAGSYYVVVTNAPATNQSATSNTVTLTVNQAPAITSQPVGNIIASGSNYTLTPGFDPGSPAPTYQWQLSTDGLNYSNVPGGTNSTLSVTGATNTSGFYKVTATNSTGSVTSSVVYVGIPSTQSVSFKPGNNATNISIDQQLRIIFPSAPKLGLAGVLQIHDASNGNVVATIDRSQFVTYTLFGGTIINAAIETRQGHPLYYLPMAIHGNEVWVTLSAAQRLSYGKTYYVTMDAGLLIDSSNGAFPAITDTTAWRFSTKVSGPATPTASTGPTIITVGLDGTGDFATFQGALDWIPQNNTLPRTIHVKPGIYRDTTYIAQNRNFVTLVGDGASRNDVQLIDLYGAEVYGSGARGMGALNIASNDVTVRDLTIDIADYVAQPNLAGGFAPGAPAFAGAINTVLTTGKRLVFDNVLIKGGQDTLYVNTGIAYFNKCEIWGSVDYIYGDALAVFDQCNIVQIRDTGGPIGAPSTPLAQPYGLVFLNCTFPLALVADGYPYNVGANNTQFIRPWRQDGATAIINCQLGTQISTKGWLEWDGRENTCRAREYGSTMIGGGAAPTPAQRQAAGAYWLNTIDPDYVANPSLTGPEPILAPPSGNTNRQPVTVNPGDYTLTAIFGNSYFNLNGWMPSLVPRITTQPTGQSVNPGQSVTFTAAATGAPGPTYQWYKNGTAISGGTNSTYNIPSAAGTDWGSYTVIATNAAGSTTSSAASLVVNDPLAQWANSYGLDPATTGSPTADPDNDGIKNKMEFFFGWNPKQAENNAPPVACSVSNNGNQAIVFEFNRNKSASGVGYTVKYCYDLTGTWSSAVDGVNGVTVETTSLGANFDHIKVTIPTNQAKAFARLEL